MAEIIIQQESSCVNPLAHTYQITLEIILNLCNQRGYCWAHNETLATMRQKDEATITRHVGILVKRGYLQWRRVGNERWLYPGKNAYPMQSRSKPNADPHNTKETLRATKGKDSVCQQQEAVSPPTNDTSVRKVSLGNPNDTEVSLSVAPVHEAVCTGAPPAAPRTTSSGAGMGYADKKERSEENDTERVQGQTGSSSTNSTSPAHEFHAGAGSHVARGEKRTAPDNRQDMGDSTRNRARVERGVRCLEAGADSLERGQEAGGLASLIAEGVSPTVAAQIVASHDAQTIRHKILHYRQQRALGKAKSVGFLVASFYKQWSCKVMDATPEQIEAQQQKRRQQGYVSRRAIQPATVTERPQESAETATARLAALRRLQRHSEGIGGVGV